MTHFKLLYLAYRFKLFVYSLVIEKKNVQLKVLKYKNLLHTKDFS